MDSPEVYAESFGVCRAGSDEPVTPVAALLQQFLLAVSMGSSCDRERRLPYRCVVLFFRRIYHSARGIADYSGVRTCAD